MFTALNPVYCPPSARWETSRERETISDKIEDIAKDTGAYLPEGFY